MGGLVRGSPRGGFRGQRPPDVKEVFKKFVKKAMNNLQFFQNFQEKFRIFEFF